MWLNPERLQVEVKDVFVFGNFSAETINTISDRCAKRNFQPVDPKEVLAKVSTLSIQRWSFQSDAKNTPHLGPMAQDFQAAFNVGVDDKHIATMDADGVALAAIQGLNQKLEMELKLREERISKLEERLRALEQRLEASMTKGE